MQSPVDTFPRGLGSCQPVFLLQWVQIPDEEYCFINKLSEIFNVTTDYLLKETEGEESTESVSLSQNGRNIRSDIVENGTLDVFFLRSF